MGKRVGSYELNSKIGKGTYGVVYLGKHVPSRNKVAIKMISRQSLRPEQQERLEDEILIQSRMESPYIVKLIDVQKTDNNIYLILEYCAGGDLRQFIQSNGPVQEEHAQQWMRQLAEAFKQLQAKKIIHRDLKLQNILLTEPSVNGEVKLCDFGMSRYLGDVLAQTWLGTPLYMAPEVFKGKGGYDARADIWSLGVVLHEILTGQPPFDVRRKEDIPMAQKNLKAFPEHFSEECRDLLGRMLKYDMSERITFEEFFVHPFVAKPPEKEEVSEVPEEQSEDFVILENDEFDDDFHYLAKDAHPTLNIQEVNQTLERIVETAMCIANLADRMLDNKELISGFAIYVKACNVLKNGSKYIEGLISKHHLQPDNHPAVFDPYNRVTAMYKEFADKTERMKRDVEALLSTKDISRLNWNYSIGPAGLANSLIFQYAVKLCKEGSYDEYIKNYASSRERYQEAIVLLEYLCNGKDSKNPDWDTVDKFKVETQCRLDTVNVKLTTA